MSRGLTITPIWGSSITSNRNVATIQNTIISAIQIYEGRLLDPITVIIKFEEMTNGLGSSSTHHSTISYSDYCAALASHATTGMDFQALAHLPIGPNNPANNSLGVDIKRPLARALGFAPPPTQGDPDGTISLNTGIMNLSAAQADPNLYSLSSVVCHEINEVLGLNSALDFQDNGLHSENGDPSPTGAVSPEDLFRYDHKGARSFTTSLNATSYFSVDGFTRLARFNQDDGTDRGVSNVDFGDWDSANGQSPHVQDAFGTPGASPDLGIELTALDIIGYNVAPVYRVTDLGLLPGYFASYGNCINSNGQVAGYSDSFHAFVYRDGSMTDLGFGQGNAINNLGQVAVYTFSRASGVYIEQALLYSGETIINLGTLGGTRIQPYGINDYGHVVGRATLMGDSITHAFLYSGGAMADLGTLGGSGANAFAINNSGQIVGGAYTVSNLGWHAFLYSGGRMTDLGTFGGTSSEALGINNRGQVVGRAYFPANASEHAFLYSEGAMIDLGTLGGRDSEAFGINSRGQIIGRSLKVDNYWFYPFIYSGGIMRDLNSLIETNSGWTIEYVNAINDNGQLVATGTSATLGTHALLLSPSETPVIETSAVVLRVSAPSNGQLAFSWNAIAEQMWQLQFKTNLTQTAWVNQGSPILVTNAIMTLHAAIGTDPERFYRISLVR